MHIVHWFVLENDPCVSPYSKIDDYRRSVSFTSNSDNPSVLCDTTLKKGWYRVTSKTGELMPTQCPQIGACGTYYGIWLKGGKECLMLVTTIYSAIMYHILFKINLRENPPIYIHFIKSFSWTIGCLNKKEKRNKVDTWRSLIE